MAGENFHNVFAVADDDQIIYQWNGADYRRLDQFRADFDAALLQIPTNFRCPPEVVTCANKLIACNLLRNADKRPLIAGRDPSGAPSVIEVLSFPSDDDEAGGIAQHIADHHAGALERIAVLARIRRLLDPIADALTALDINSQVIVRRDEFQSAAFGWLHNALRLAVHNTDERVFRAFAGTFNEMFGSRLLPGEIIAQSQADRVDLLRGWHRAVHGADRDLRMRWPWRTPLHGITAATWIMPASPQRRSWSLTDGSRTMRPMTKSQAAFSAVQNDRAAWHALSAEVGRSIGVPVRSRAVSAGTRSPIEGTSRHPQYRAPHNHPRRQGKRIRPRLSRRSHRRRATKLPEQEEGGSVAGIRGRAPQLFCRCHTMPADPDAQLCRTVFGVGQGTVPLFQGNGTPAGRFFVTAPDRRHKHHLTKGRLL